MKKVLVSSCLLGHAVRYDGGHLRSDDAVLRRWVESDVVLPFCPEVAAGMPTPRTPAEIQAGSGASVLDRLTAVLEIGGADVSEAFIRGAEIALEICLEHNISMAVLTDGSPSCGSRFIYNGAFAGERIEGNGVTTALLLKNGVKVFNQYQLDAADKHFCAH